MQLFASAPDLLQLRSHIIVTAFVLDVYLNSFMWALSNWLLTAYWSGKIIYRKKVGIWLATDHVESVKAWRPCLWIRVQYICFVSIHDVVSDINIKLKQMAELLVTAFSSATSDLNKLIVRVKHHNRDPHYSVTVQNWQPKKVTTLQLEMCHNILLLCS